MRIFFFINAPGLKEKKLQQKQINLYTHVGYCMNDSVTRTFFIVRVCLCRPGNNITKQQRIYSSEDLMVFKQLIGIPIIISSATLQSRRI